MCPMFTHQNNFLGAFNARDHEFQMSRPMYSALFSISDWRTKVEKKENTHTVVFAIETWVSKIKRLQIWNLAFASVSWNSS